MKHMPVYRLLGICPPELVILAKCQQQAVTATVTDVAIICYPSLEECRFICGAHGAISHKMAALLLAAKVVTCDGQVCNDSMFRMTTTAPSGTLNSGTEGSVRLRYTRT